MKALFEDINTVLYNEEYGFKEKVSCIIFMLSNDDEEKYDQLIELLEEPSIEQIDYAINGNSKTELVEDKDKFMWILRYGLCGGNEEKTKRVFEVITGRVVIDINFN